MSDQLIIDGKKFISSRRAAQACSYTQDYVGQLIRDGKIEATKVGRLWFVCESSILNYHITADKGANLLSSLKSQSLSQKESKPLIHKAISDAQAIDAPKVFLEKLLKYDSDSRGLLPELKKVSVKPEKIIIATPVVKPTAVPVQEVKKSITVSEYGKPSYTKKFVALALICLIAVSSFNFVNSKNIGSAFKSLGLLKERIFNFSTEVAAGIQSASETGSPVLSSNDFMAAVSNAGVVTEGVLEASAVGVYEFINPLFNKGWTLVFGSGKPKVEVAQVPAGSTLNSAKEKLANIGKTDKPATSTNRIPVSDFVVSGNNQASESEESVVVRPEVIVQNFNTSSSVGSPVESNSLQYSFSARQVADLVSLDFNQRIDLLQNSFQTDLATVSSRVDLLLQNIRTTSDRLSQRTSSGGGGGGTTIINNSVDTTDLTLTNPTLAGTVTVTGATTFSNNVDFANITFLNATGTNATTTALYIEGTVRGAGLSSCSGSSDKLIWNSTTGQFSCGTDAGAGGGITALRGEFSSNQSGAGQVFATSSDTNIGLTITSASDIHTFTPTWTGTLSASRGGTGIANPSAAGILIGSYAGGTYQQIATSSLGLLTTDVAEGSNLYYQNSRVQTFLDTLNKGYFYSTTSADYWLTQQNISAFSTTSANNYASLFNAFTVQGNGYLAPTTTRGLIVNASSTIGNGIEGLTVNGAATTTGRAYFASNIGIGSTTPVLGSVVIDGPGSGSFLGFPANFVISQNDENSWGLGIYNEASGIGWSNWVSNSGRFSIGNATDASVVTLDVNGLMGINDASPDAALEVTGAGGASTLFMVSSDDNTVDNGNRFIITNLGNVGIATTSPFEKLSVAGSAYIGGNLVATGTASTTNLAITSITGSTQCLQVNSLGQVSGTGSACGSGSGSWATTSSDYYASQFRDWNVVSGTLRPTTTLGLIVSASSTIGSGVATGGLTINGTATTTGSAYFGGNVGIGTTSPYAKLSVSGQVVADNFTATSTTATSSFAGGVVVGQENVYAGRSAFAVGTTTGSAVVSAVEGSMVYGAASGTLGGTGSIQTTIRGGFAGGVASGILGSGNASILSSGSGSLAYGVAVGIAAPATLSASANGSVAFGYAFRNLTSSGDGSFAAGYANAGAVTSTGSGSFAFGDNVNATAALSTAFGKGFTNSSADTFQVGYTANPTLTVSATGIGAGTTSPFALLSVAGNAYIGGNLTATGTASTTNLAITSITGSTQCLQVNSLGQVSGTGSACGAGSSSWATSSSDYYASNFSAFTVQGNGYLAPTTTRGLILTASSTLANVTLVNATTTNSTTTGNAYFASRLGIGTTTPAATSSITAYGNLYLEGTGRYVNFGSAFQSGSGGYGIRENGGVIEFRNAYSSSTILASNWTPISSAASVRYQLTEGGWVNTGATLPGNLGESQSAVIGDYVYLFGGNNSSVASTIYRAPVSNPTSWVNTGATIPGILQNSQVLVIGDYVYLFGGYGSGYTNVIYRAPVSNPTSWTNTGATLPGNLGNSQVLVIGDYIYLYGGDNGSVTNVIYRAPVSNPTSWTNTGATLPGNLGYSQGLVLGDYVYLFGGDTGSASGVIYRAPVSNPTSWTNTGATLPAALNRSQIAVVGDYVYLFGGYNGSYTNVIYRAPVSNPTSWTDTGYTIPGNLDVSQVSVIGDNVYLFGGYNGSSYTNVIYRAPITSNANLNKNYIARLNAPVGPWFNTSSSSSAVSYITGNVGIGTTSPFALLSVAGSAYIGGNLTATGTASTTNLAITSITGSTQCLQVNSLGQVTGTGSACGAGGGSGGGSWSTTTSTVSGTLINYPNNTSDVVAIGSNSTTTAEFYFDPNINTASITGKLKLLGSNSEVLIGQATGGARGFKSVEVQSENSSFGSEQSGAYSSLFGYNNYSVAASSTLIGLSNVVDYTDSPFATLLGASNYVDVGSSYATLVGYSNYVKGKRASVFGYDNASDVFSDSASVFGYQNYTTAAASSTVIGYKNTASAASTTILGADITNDVANSLMIGPSDAAKLTVLGAAGSVGYVGIGTTSPYAKLSVVSSVTPVNVFTQGTAFTVDTSGALAWDGYDSSAEEILYPDMRLTSLRSGGYEQFGVYGNGSVTMGSTTKSFMDQTMGEASSAYKYSIASMKTMVPGSFEKNVNGFLFGVYDPASVATNQTVQSTVTDTLSRLNVTGDNVALGSNTDSYIFSKAANAGLSLSTERAATSTYFDIGIGALATEENEGDMSEAFYLGSNVITDVHTNGIDLLYFHPARDNTMLLTSDPVERSAYEFDTIHSLTTAGLFKVSTATSTRFSILGDGTTFIHGNLGVGTTSPFAKLSTAGSAYIGGNLTATGTVAFTGLVGCNTIDTDANGVLSCGTDEGGVGGTWATTSSNYYASQFRDFSVQGNGYLAPTTTRGLILNASSTIGSGAQAGGLTINGGATTTGNAYIAGSLAIGTTTATSLLEIVGSGIPVIELGSIGSATTRGPHILLSDGGVDKAVIDFMATASAGAHRVGSLEIRNVAGGDTYFYSGANTNPLDVILAVDSSGNVGVGTTSPYAKLTVQATTSSSAPLFVVASSTAGTATSTAFIIDAFGKVGVGTTSPYAKLSVAGETVSRNFTATSTTATSTIAGGLDVGSGALVYDYSSGITSINGLNLSGSLSFDTDAGIVSWSDLPVSSSAAANTVQSYSAQIDSNPILTVYAEANGSGGIQDSGVGIGTSTPQRKLHVYTTADEAPVRFEDANGYCEINPTSTTWTCTSDRSLKKDIQNVATDETLQRMAQLQAVSFRWNKEDTSDSLRYGFIAQDVEAVFPELVTTGTNGLKSVAYGGFTPFIIEAIKSLNLSVTNLENRMLGIEGRLAALETYAEANGFERVIASTTDEFASSTATTTASTTIAIVSGWIESLGAKIENAIATFVSVVAESLTANIAYIKTVEADTIQTKTLRVGDIDNLAKSGVTVLDRSSGLPTCIYMEAGIMRTEPGECGSYVPTPAIPPNNDGDEGGDTGTTTPDVIDNNGDTGDNGTTTPPVIEEEPVPPVEETPLVEPPVVDPAPVPEVPAETP